MISTNDWGSAPFSAHFIHLFIPWDVSVIVSHRSPGHRRTIASTVAELSTDFSTISNIIQVLFGHHISSQQRLIFGALKLMNKSQFNHRYHPIAQWKSLKGNIPHIVAWESRIAGTLRILDWAMASNPKWFPRHMCNSFLLWTLTSIRCRTAERRCDERRNGFQYAFKLIPKGSTGQTLSQRCDAK